MKLIKLNCTACGAPISIPDDIDQLNCAVCGSLLYLERGEGYYSLKIAEKIADAIQQSGKSTEDAIRETAEMTQKELRRMQISQNLRAVEGKISATQNEQKVIAGQPPNPYKTATLDNLYFQEWCQCEEYRNLQMQMDVLDGPELEKNELALDTQINFIDHSLLVMRMLLDTPEHRKLRQSLVEEQNLYRGYLIEARKNKRRSEISSFKISKPFSQDLGVVETQLTQLAADINRIRSQAPSPENGQIFTELGVLHNQLFTHWVQQVRFQAWGEINPAIDPGNDVDKLASYLQAIHFEMDHLSRMPNLPRDLSNHLRDLGRQDKALTKRHLTMTEHIHYNESLATLRSTLIGLAIAAPFSMNTGEVQSQLADMHTELTSLAKRPSAPEVDQVRQELTARYGELYKHWAGLREAEVKKSLPSLEIPYPYPTDYPSARELYEQVCKDVDTLKTMQDFPGSTVIKQEVLQIQRKLYAHILTLKKA